MEDAFERLLAAALERRANQRFRRRHAAKEYEQGVIVEGSEAIRRWEQDHSLALDATQVRQEVMMAAMALL